MGRWLIRANFGKVDGNPEDTTVPGWLLGEEGRARDLVWTSAKHAATIIAQFRKIQRKKPGLRTGIAIG